MRQRPFGFVRPDDGRFIGHFETVGAIWQANDVEHRRMHAGISTMSRPSDEVKARPPGEGAARFEIGRRRGWRDLKSRSRAILFRRSRIRHGSSGARPC